MSENEQSPERKNRMGRLNQPPRPEGCRQEGQGEGPAKGPESERPAGSVPRDSRGPQAGAAPCQGNSASKLPNADGDGVRSPEPNMEGTAEGEVPDSPPGSESVARDEGEVRNLRDPQPSRRSNYCELPCVSESL